MSRFQPRLNAVPKMPTPRSAAATTAALRSSAVGVTAGLIGWFVLVELVSGILQGYYVPLFSDIVVKLGIHDSDVNWFEASQLLLSALVVPILAKLGDMYGHKKILLIAAVLTAGATWWLAFATSFWSFLVAWALQGFYVVWLPLEIALIFERGRRQSRGVSTTRRAAGLLVAGLQAGAILANAAGDKTDYANPGVVEALQYWVDLSQKHKVHPPGIVEWGTTPRDFFEKKCAMMWTTTGNLTNVRSNAKFPFGVAMLPANKRRGSPTGGGNFYLSKKVSKAEQEAAFKFIQWITSPERAAKWGIDTGYVAVRRDAWDTPVMKDYVAGFPAAAVARDQLEFSVAELSTHENQRVTKALNDGLQAALNGTKTPEAAMKDSQAEAERILRSYR